MAILLDFLKTSTYDQQFYVYVTNDFDQNLPVYKGRVFEMCLAEDQYSESLLDALGYEVVVFYVCSDGGIQIYLKDDCFYDRAEKKWSSSPEYVAEWDSLKPETRPWLHSSETERYTLRRLENQLS